MPVLNTHRLCLQPYGEADRGVFVDLVSDPTLMSRLGGPVHSPDALFRRLLDRDAKAGEIAWAVTWRDAEGFVGHVWLQGLSSGSTPQLGFVIASSQAGRGVATEAAAAALRYGLEVLEIPVIEATVDSDHEASRRVLEKIGMRRAREQRDEDGTFLVYESQG